MSRIAWPVALGLPALLLFLVNVSNGYHPTDDGLIYSWSWRIFNGEVPYRDFYYIRTPLTLYIHTAWLWLPDGFQIPAGRLAYYLEMVGVLAFPLRWAVHTGRIRTDVRSLGLVTIGLAFGLHNFPPMPWYTVDGLLFGSFSLMALLYSYSAHSVAGVLTWRALASVSVALAALCKQNFSVIPLMLFVIAIVELARGNVRPRWPVFLASLLPGTAVAAAAVTYLALVGALGTAFAQLTGTIPAGEPMFSAVFAYLRFPVAITIVVLVPATFVMTWVARRPPSTRLRLAVQNLALSTWLIGLVLIGVAAVILEATGWGAYRLGHPMFWALAGIASALTVLYVRHRTVDAQTLVLDWGVLVLAWASSISGGYASPTLGLVLMGIPLSHALPPSHGLPFRTSRESLVVVAGVTAMLALQLTLNIQYPYRDRPRLEQTANLGEIYPRFGRLFTNQANYDRFAELHAMTTHFATARGLTFAVMPTYALIYFLSGTRNPVGINTYSTVEFRGYETQLQREFDERRPVVFIERDTPTPVGAYSALRLECGQWSKATQPAIAGHIVETWHLIASGNSFCAYEHP